MRSRRFVAALAATVALTVLGWVAVRTMFGRRIETQASAITGYDLDAGPRDVWPGPDARLTVAAAHFPADFGVRRVVIDPGHGAAHNTGNTSCFCEEEQAFTLDAAEALRDRLEATGHFEVKLSRESDDPIEYQARVDDAARFGAEAFLSLHSDVRGKADRWSPDGGASCPVSLVAPGFSVLYSDEGEAELIAQRRSLALAVARRMEQAGLRAYGGGSYKGLYESVLGGPGVFLDRHAQAQRIFILRKTTMPSVLIETHHALDPREAARWEQASTLDAFAAAVAAALVDLLAPKAPP